MNDRGPHAYYVYGQRDADDEAYQDIQEVVLIQAVGRRAAQDGHHEERQTDEGTHDAHAVGADRVVQVDLGKE